MVALVAGWVWVLLAGTGLAGGPGGYEAVLAPGMTGPAVLQLQHELYSLGLEVGRDGVYGPETAEAVRKLQRTFGLAPDGVAGPDTRRLLERLLLHYTLRPGDTLYALARTFDLSLERLLAVNGLEGSDVRRLRPGQQLLLPYPRLPRRPPVHQVRSGETLSAIAYRHGTTVEALLTLNHLEDPGRLLAGTWLMLPPAGGSDAGQRVPGGVPAGTSPAALLQGSLQLDWPARATVSSPFGWRLHPVYGTRHFHAGIDLALPPGSPVRAAAAGRVLRAGWMDAYGYAVILDHGRGVRTYYGHLSSLAVRAGARVRRGQVIARSGDTGVSTGPHLDFRVEIGGKAVDPLAFLAP